VFKTAFLLPLVTVAACGCYSEPDWRIEADAVVSPGTGEFCEAPSQEILDQYSCWEMSGYPDCEVRVGHTVQVKKTYVSVDIKVPTIIQSDNYVAGTKVVELPYGSVVSADGYDIQEGHAFECIAELLVPVDELLDE